MAPCLLASCWQGLRVKETIHHLSHSFQLQKNHLFLQHHIHTQKLLSSNTMCTVYIWWPGTPRCVLTPSSLTDGSVGVCSCRVAEKEPINKMSLHNLATVFGPTLLRPSESESTKGQHITSASDIWSHDVMAQVPTHSGFVQCVFIIYKIVAFIFCVCETQSTFIPRSHSDACIKNLINKNWGFRLWADAVNGRLVCPCTFPRLLHSLFPDEFHSHIAKWPMLLRSALPAVFRLQAIYSSLLRDKFPVHKCLFLAE